MPYRRRKSIGSGYYVARDSKQPGRDTQAYRKFTKAVRKRDKNYCQFPGCDHKCKLMQVHHIMLFADNPLLRYEERNGILLCKTCHERIRGAEAYYIEVFTNIVIKKYDSTN